MAFAKIPKKKSDFYIMIVDDERDFLSSMEFWFKSQGYSVKALMSGKEAVEFVKKKTPSVIFLNLQMPQKEGLETLRQIREMDISVPVVMLSAFGADDSNIDAYKLGVNGFFDKSHNFYQAEHLINALVRIVTGKNSRKAPKQNRHLRMWLLILMFALIALDLFLLMPPPLARVCFKDACLKVELALTAQERARGLMERASLAKNHGMLFVFPYDDFWAFWMKDTKVPLDIIWIDNEKRVVDIVENAQPALSENPPTFKSAFPARYGLETKAGFVKENDIKIGAQARINLPVIVFPHLRYRD
jgi:hypothetical protein